MFEPEQLDSSRFFFHLVSDEEVILDEDGVNLSLHDGVLVCASRAIDELRQEGFFAAAAWHGWQIEITDSTGRTILRVPLDGGEVESCALAVH